MTPVYLIRQDRVIIASPRLKSEYESDYTCADFTQYAA